MEPRPVLTGLVDCHTWSIRGESDFLLSLQSSSDGGMPMHGDG